jgi:hypothetical protein
VRIRNHAIAEMADAGDFGAAVHWPPHPAAAMMTANHARSAEVRGTEAPA